MKKKIIIIIVVFVVIALLISGYFIFKNKKSKENNNSKGSCVIELDSNPSTGYDWEYKIGEKGIIKISEEYIEGKDSDIKTGVPGVSKFTLYPVKDGNTTIVFKYKRSFETEVIEERNFSISVVEKTVVVNPITK